MQPIKPSITVSVEVNAKVDDVWRLWTTPADIKQWNNPFEDWHNPRVELDLKDGGKFFYRMESKDGLDGFNYCGNYDKVETFELIELTTSDGRKAVNTFKQDGDKTIITETFEPEPATPQDVQRDFCQRILNNFKAYAEKNT